MNGSRVASVRFSFAPVVTVDPVVTACRAARRLYAYPIDAMIRIVDSATVTDHTISQPSVNSVDMLCLLTVAAMQGDKLMANFTALAPNISDSALAIRPVTPHHNRRQYANARPLPRVPSSLRHSAGSGTPSAFRKAPIQRGAATGTAAILMTVAHCSSLMAPPCE
jgi:hypothetical protein